MPKVPNELTAAEQAELAQQQALQEEQEAANFTTGGGGAISDMQTQAYGHTYKPAPPNTRIAYSGSDTKAYIVTYGQVAKDSFIPLENLAAISYSVHRDKAPVRRLGSFVAESYTKGTRTIAGSIVIVNFDRAAFYELVSGVDVYGQQGAEIELIDNIPPFDILLVFSEENKGRMGALWQDGKIGPAKPEDAADFSYMWIRNVHFVDEGAVTGTEEAYIETTLQYVAEHVEYMRPNNIFQQTSDVGDIADTLDPTPAGQEWQRAVPYRIFLTQNDEVVDYSTYTEQMWLDGTKGIEATNHSATAEFTVTESDNKLDPATCSCSDGGTYAGEAECLAANPGTNTWNCNKIFVPALRLGGTEGKDSIWRRQETRIDLSQPNYPAHLTNYTDLTFNISGRVTGTSDAKATVGWESYTVEPFAKRLTIKNSHFLPPPEAEKKKWWRPFKAVVDDRPKYGNKFQNDLHNIGKAKYEEITETVNYDAADHAPGVIPFDVQSGILDQSLSEFENDLDDHVTALSSSGEHVAERVDDDTISAVINEDDVQSTETFEMEVEIPLFDYSSTRSYVNMSNPPVNIDYTFNFTTDLSNAPHPFLNSSANAAHQLVIDRDGSGENPFTIVNQDLTGEGYSVTVSCPPQEPEPQTVYGNRAGPGLVGHTKTANYTFNGSTGEHTFIGDTDLPHVGPNPDNGVIHVAAEHAASGYSLDVSLKEFANMDENGQEITAGDTATPHHTEFTVEGYDQKIDANPITVHVHKSQLTEEIVQPTGTYTWPQGSSDMHEFSFQSTSEGDPGNEYIHSITSVEYDNSEQLTTMNNSVVNYHSHEGNSFAATGLRGTNSKYETTTFQQWGDGNVKLIEGDGNVTGQEILNRYNIWAPATGGGANTVDAYFTTLEGLGLGYLNIPLVVIGDDIYASLGTETAMIDNGTSNGGLQYSQHEAIIPGDYGGTIHTIQKVEFFWFWSWKQETPIGLTYVRTDPTPITQDITLTNKLGSPLAVTQGLVDEDDIEITVQDEYGQYHDCPITLDSTGTNYVVTVSELPPHLDTTIVLNHKVIPTGMFETNINYKTYQNQAFESTVEIDLGPDEIVNFSELGEVVLKCADSMADEGFIDPAAFGITIGPLVTSCSDGTSGSRTDCEAQNQTWSNKITISDIPAMLILNPNQSGWFGNIWNQLFGDPSQPQGNIDITVNYFNLPFTSSQLPIVFNYKYAKHPVDSTVLTDNQARGIDFVSLIGKKEYAPGEDVKIINPLQVDTSANPGGTCAGGQATGTEATQTECEQAPVNGTWTPNAAFTPALIPYTGAPSNQSAITVHEVTDYANTTNPPSLSFEVTNVKAIATDDGDNKFPITLTYDIQKGLFPVELTYVRALNAETYAGVDLFVDYNFTADVPILTAPATKPNGDIKVGGGPLSGSIDIVNKVWWIPEDPNNAGTFLTGSKVELQPADPTVLAGCSGGTCTGNEADEASCNSCNGTWVAEDGTSFDVSDVTKAYYTEDNTNVPDLGLNIVFPTGLNPTDDTLQTALNEVGPDYNGNGDKEYRIEVEYKTLDLFIPASKYLEFGYLMTALVNIEGTLDQNDDALEVVVDLDSTPTSINYYRGKGVCGAIGTVFPGTCAGAGAVSTYNTIDLCNGHGTCTVDTNGTITTFEDETPNSCSARADASQSPPTTAVFTAYTWTEAIEEPYYTAADCIAAGNKWTFKDEEDIALCEQSFGGKWITAPGIQDPTKMEPAGICEIETAQMNSLIEQQLLVQFSFMFAGPNAGPGNVGLDLYKHPEKYTTMDEAVVQMKKKYDERFGKKPS
tara:strand:- start:540 stop:5918 length:5379 start_codon:yes stop_codon:yes gene_type:complete